MAAKMAYKSCLVIEAGVGIGIIIATETWVGVGIATEEQGGVDIAIEEGLGWGQGVSLAIEA